jgi:hypothetical protein
VSDDVTFVGPLMQAAGAREYVAMNEQLLGFHAGSRMLHQFEDGNDVCSIYELDMKTPAGDSVTLTMADWIRVGGGKVISHRCCTRLMNDRWMAFDERRATRIAVVSSLPGAVSARRPSPGDFSCR